MITDDTISFCINQRIATWGIVLPESKEESCGIMGESLIIWFIIVWHLL